MGKINQCCKPKETTQHQDVDAAIDAALLLTFTEQYTDIVFL